MAMATIFINCGFPLAVVMGGFGNLEKHQGLYTNLGWISKSFNIGIISFSGGDLILVIAGLMVLGTALFLNSRAFSSQGVAIALFTGIFWIPFGTTSLIIRSVAKDFPGLNIIWSIYFLIAILIFAIAMIQLPTGGQKSHV